MMPNIVRRADPGGTMAYLVDCESPKNLNVHTHPHVVTGTIGMEFVGTTLTKGDAAKLAAGLRANQQVTGKEDKAGHIWHCSLALSADEGQLGDQRWAAVAHDFMQGMGFGPDTRWVAVDHGTSREGNSHIHLVASTIKQNGAKVNTWQDMPRSQKLCTELEIKHGLKVLESRMAMAGAGSVPYTQAEAAETAKQGKVEPDRVNLERQVRAIAASVDTEAEFVKTAKAKGLLLRPFPKLEGAKVTGYSIGIRAPRGARQDYFSGGQLARDLTLPQLRRGWVDTDGGAETAQRAWRGTLPVKAKKLAPQPRSIESAHAELIGAQSEYRAVTPEQLADLSHDLAGTLAIASEATEPVPGPLAKASREVGAWAQPKGIHRVTAPRPVHTKSAAKMFAIAMDPQSRKSDLLVMQQLAEMVTALYRLHLAARQVATRERSQGMSAQADGLDDFIHDGVTMATVGGSRLAEVHAQRKTRALAQGDGGIGSREWEGMSREQRAQIPEQAPRTPGTWEPWTAEDFRRSRHQVRAEEIHQQFLDRPPLATLDQQERLQDLSARLGLPGMADAVGGVSEAQAAAVIKQMELAAEGYGPPGTQWQPFGGPDRLLPQPGLASQTGLGAISTSEDAEAFMARLERNAEARQTATPVSPQAAVAPAHAPIMQGDKDPRQWASAGESVTQRQQYALKQAGFSVDEIATLKKGSASYVIGHGDLGPGEARKAFERNAQAAPWTPTLRAVDAVIDQHRANIPTDIRNRQRPPTQRQ